MISWQSSPPAWWTGTTDQYQESVAAVHEMQYRRCQQDPWFWIKNFTTTKDQLDPVTPDKPFPDLDYLRYLVDFLLTELVVVIPKSRRVLATWLVSAFNCWDCQFNQARQIGYQNENEEKAQEMVEMTSVIYQSQPEWIRARNPCKATGPEMKWSRTRSKIIALPSGPNMVRLYTFSRIWSDEVTSQKLCDEGYQAALPTIRGRTADRSGQLVYTSTAADHWFELLCKDELVKEKAPPPLWERQLVDGGPMWRDGQKFHGVHLTRLADSGYLVYRIHYTADPEKRTEDWYHWTRKGIPDDVWEQEYEVNFEAKAGKPALKQITKYESAIVRRPFLIPHWWPRWASADYGTVNPYSCHFHTMSPDREIFTYWEYYGPGPLLQHLTEIKAHPDFPKLLFYILDRSCWTESHQSSETVNGRTSHMLTSIAQLHEDNGVTCIPAAVVQDRVKIEAWNRVWPEPPPDQPFRPTYFILDTCPALLRELPWIRWRKRTHGQKLSGKMQETLVDEDNHAFDDCSYGLLHIETPGQEPDTRVFSEEEARSELRRSISLAAVDTAVRENEEHQGDDADGLD